MRTIVSLALLAACGSGTASGPVSEPARSTAPVAPPPPTTSSAPVVQGHATAPTAEEIWRRVSTDLTACYENGRKTVPEMVDGRIAFVTSVDAGGKTTCVVPSDDTGLTAEVEDCMRTRLERESFAATGAPWSARLPVQVKAARVALGGPTAQTSIDTIESRGLAEDVYTVLDGLLPDVKECVRGGGKASGRRVVVVGARVAKDGAVACAVASSEQPVTDEARGCLAAVFSRARFQAPKRGTGLLSVPIEITR